MSFDKLTLKSQEALQRATARTSESLRDTKKWFVSTG